MRIALFGGSFDPPHAGHDAIVKEALSANLADLLVIMPTFINPFKSEFTAPPSLRLKWCQSLWGERENILISDYEISQNRKVATIESVKFLKQKFNPSQIYLIIGADNLAELEKWQNFEQLRDLVCFVIATREGASIPIKWANLPKININVKISSSSFRASLKGEIPAQIKDEVINFYKGKKCKK
ncbi:MULTISPECIES: nicotinate (nicotinamide) nucleotide adenylyltransferase [unclassified Campylobacter]|uniref:nicotinate (nicotinamide) nucleotide adenylyltransferase n=1 Tax=unclassified Campylobacter TaxID=2593542 RepID=UPI0022EA08E8|nr:MULTISPECIES: nicotinate (nicotinamide) nucleotide adenylyltransferase [unclassified Campylobacter]MDA3055244.1 nicotinate (nicotinamide) nucleotide adenylyltransferase [Campylobacter sp. VBCF_07 NA4]MDA3071013.1 nicotinate (nicotinamide) nucleotide adenylyltransferase [Campylobacter sp. VBCF_08 NA3]WBR53947.1 nicotinate (nicotinamide) nucleotide adenylyltransferase [Campylobacter sp. VBCF_01 NA2]